jgi:hypothetical protein
MAERTNADQLVFYHTVTSAEATANAVVIAIEDDADALPTRSGIFMGQLLRAGVEIPGFDWSYDTATGELTVADAGSADLTANDEIVILFNYVG